MYSLIGIVVLYIILMLFIQVGPTLEALAEQLVAHQSLQADLEKEQANINSLSNMVVVVDESSSDAGEF